MRRYQLIDTLTYDLIDGAHVVGLARGDGTANYMMFQRSPVGDPNDLGIYFEYDDQNNSGYNVIAACRVSQKRIEIDFSKPFPTVNGILGIDADYQVDSVTFQCFIEGLKQVFRNEEVKLSISA